MMRRGHQFILRGKGHKAVRSITYADSPLNLEAIVIWMLIVVGTAAAVLLLLGLVMVERADAEWISSDGSTSTITSTQNSSSTTIVNSPPPAQDVTIQNSPPPPLPANMPALIINGTGNWPPPPAGGAPPPPARPLPPPR